jgi:hypothetical protein
MSVVAGQNCIRRKLSVHSLPSLLSLMLALVAFLGVSHPASAAPLSAVRVHAIPAFARKYGMPCSSCHLAWPMLSPFGQAFKDNGYQMGNDRDAPIFQNPAYWPVTFRMTTFWHRENENRAQVDGPGGVSGNEANYTAHGFDWSGLDFHTGGTLAKNVSFYVLPSSDNTGAFHFETVFARLDNLAGTSWLNVKLGKFELDNLLSEKRILTLTNVSGVYTNYHFQPATEIGANGAFPGFGFGIGDNQVGMEVMGHSKDDRTRYSVAVLSSNDGSPGLPTSRGYDTFLTFSQAFQAGSFGLQRIGVFDYIGQAPTYFQYTNGSPGDSSAGLAGTGIGNKGFYRAGLIGQFYIKKFDITAMYFHSSDNKYLATSTAADGIATLPAGARNATWNGALFESHFMYNPQFIIIQRVELVRMSQQALPIDSTALFTPGVSVPSADFGNENVYTFGFRYYPFISSRAGFAFHNEYAYSHQVGTSPVTGRSLDFSSALIGFDFAF